MKTPIQVLNYWRLKFGVRKLLKAMENLARHGTVREIHQAAEMVRTTAKNTGNNQKDYEELADSMDENAEKVILRRVFK